MTINSVNIYSYASASVTTSAYTTLVNSTPITVSRLQVCDTSGELLKLAVGLPGQEIDILVVPLNGCLIIPSYILSGQRLSIKAITNTASTGYNTVTFLNE